MTLPRTVVMVWILATLHMGNSSEMTQMTASIGKNVFLPCRCSRTTVEVAWQAVMEEEVEIVVNHYKDLRTSDKQPHDLYKDRSRLFISTEEGNCTLLLLNVSPTDQKVFKCYTFDKSEDLDIQQVNLTVKNERQKQQDDGDFSVGVPISVVAVVILSAGIIGVLLMKKRRQNRQNMEVVTDPLSGQPILQTV